MLLFHFLKGTREILYDELFKSASRQKIMKKYTFHQISIMLKKLFSISGILWHQRCEMIYFDIKKTPLTSTCGIICCSCCCVMF